MRHCKIFVPAVLVIFGLMFSLSLIEAKPEFTTKEKKSCVFCRVTAKSKELNEAGQYYRAHNHSLDG